MINIKSTVLLAAVLIAGTSVQAQDSIRKKEVNITSTFKPSLKQAAKIIQ